MVLCVGASMRLYRVYEIDAIGDPLRRMVDKPDVQWFQTLVGCIFCLGFWLCAAVVTTGYFWGDTAIWTILCASLSVNYVMAHLYRRVEDET